MDTENYASYSDNKVIEYYKRLSALGLFVFERSVIDTYFPKHSKIIDIGCGVGRTTWALSQLGYEVIGIDYSTKMIGSARKCFPSVKFDVQNVMNLQFADNSFDCALFSFNGLMLLESYAKRKKAFEEISRVLRHSGIFFFVTPFLDNKVNSRYWQTKIANYQKDLSHFSQQETIELGDEILDEDGVKFHLHIPFKEEIYNLINECGCKIIFEGRRLDHYPLETIEGELDDNYLWVIQNGHIGFPKHLNC